MERSPFKNTRDLETVRLSLLSRSLIYRFDCMHIIHTHFALHFAFKVYGAEQGHWTRRTLPDVQAYAR